MTDLAKKILKALISHEVVETIYTCSDEQTDAIDIDADEMVNGQPFWVHEVSKTTIKPKKLIICDHFLHHQLLDEGHEIFYSFLFSLNVEIMAMCFVAAKEGVYIKKVKDYAELKSLMRGMHPFEKNRAQSIIQGLTGMSVDEFEYIDYLRRKELYSLLYSIIPASFITPVKSVPVHWLVGGEVPRYGAKHLRSTLLKATEIRLTHAMPDKIFNALIDAAKILASQLKVNLTSLVITTEISQMLLLSSKALEIPSLESVTIRNAKLQNILMMVALRVKNLKYLDIRGASSEFSMKKLNLTLTYLDISETNLIIRQALNILVQCPQIRVFKADYLKISTTWELRELLEFVNKMKLMSTMKVISLIESDIGEPAFLALLNKTPHLESLSISDVGDDVKRFSSETINKMPALNDLTELYFGSDFSTKVNIANVLRKFQKLKTLALGGVEVTIDDNLNVNCQLEELSLLSPRSASDCPPHSAGFMKSILWLARNTLQSLKLEHEFLIDNIENIDLIHLKKLQLNADFMTGAFDDYNQLKPNEEQGAALIKLIKQCRIWNF